MKIMEYMIFSMVMKNSVLPQHQNVEKSGVSGRWWIQAEAP
jgi:hypothetical protein